MREVSVTALQAMMAQRTDEVFVPCLRIEHPDLTTIRLAYNNTPLVRSDGTYQPYAFQINLPDQLDNQIPRVTVTVDNIDLAVNDAIRNLVGAPKVTFDVVLASTPDVVEAGPFVFDLQAATADAQTIQGTLGYEDDIFSQQVPAQVYGPGNSKGLFT